MISINEIERKLSHPPVRGKKRVRILFADDHQIVRDGLKPYLERLADDVEVIEAASLDEAIAVPPGATPFDLVLLDLGMPGMDIAQGLTRAMAHFTGTPVVIISGHQEHQYVKAALDGGASGFIPKTTSGKSMINALRLVLDGEIYLPPSLLQASPTPDADVLGSQVMSEDNPLSRLSPRELEILRFLIDGNTNKEIARALELQEITVKVHLRNAYRKIGANNRADAVRIAFQHGWE
jgi:DNA-binding NarL/FixJ family response regulator